MINYNDISLFVVVMSRYANKLISPYKPYKISGGAPSVITPKANYRYFL